MNLTLASEAETLDLGAEVARELGAGDVLGLCGRLGAGKTHFVKGLVRGLGGDAHAVTSPTFTLVHEYADCRIPVFHFDFYRMDSIEEVLQIGWDEYLEEGEGIVLVEWADKFPEIMPEETRWWRFEIVDGGRKAGRLSAVEEPGS